MKFGVVVFPGSNCDRDMYDALKYDLEQDVTMLWHKDKDLSKFNTEDCIILPGGFHMGLFALRGYCPVQPDDAKCDRICECRG